MDQLSGVDKFLDLFSAKVFSYPDWRLGQALFNTLPNWAAAVVTEKSFDPFYKDVPDWSVSKWIDNHLIFDEQGLLAVFNNNEILAERPS